MTMASADPPPIAGLNRLWANWALAAANLIVVLDMSIANVSIPHIAGNLGITPNQGTWVITSYAVADAIAVPLTGWLSQRFGSVRTFIACMTGFGIFSLICGVSVTAGMLIVARIGQGFCGGPLMPLTQVLLMRINPPERRHRALVTWAMALAIGPAIGPVIGGYISDNWSWQWIFLINLPVVLLSLFGVITLVRPFENAVRKLPIDSVGLILLVLWVGAFQIMIDTGRELDWFGDVRVVMLGLIAAIGAMTFVIWELTEEHPIVDLRIFRHAGFSLGVFVLTIGYGSYYAGTVIVPQWMQISLGYSATLAGVATGFIAATAFISAQFPARLLAMGADSRLTISLALVWVSFATLLRSHWTSGADFWTLALPQILAGFGMPFIMMTLTNLSLAAVPAEETTSAAGLQSFVRTMSIAFTTSISITYWDSGSRYAGSDLAGVINPDAIVKMLGARGLSFEQSQVIIADLVQKEAITLSTNQMFFISGSATLLLAILVWMIPRIEHARKSG